MSHEKLYDYGTGEDETISEMMGYLEEWIDMQLLECEWGNLNE